VAPYSAWAIDGILPYNITCMSVATLTTLFWSCLSWSGVYDTYRWSFIRQTTYLTEQVLHLWWPIWEGFAALYIIHLGLTETSWKISQKVQNLKKGHNIFINTGKEKRTLTLVYKKYSFWTTDSRNRTSQKALLQFNHLEARGKNRLLFERSNVTNGEYYKGSMTGCRTFWNFYNTHRYTKVCFMLSENII